MEVIIIGASKYDFVTEEGTRLKGCKVTAVSPGMEGEYGWSFSQLSADHGLAEQFSEAPGVYRISHSISKKGVVRVTQATLLKKISFEKLLENLPASAPKPA